MDEYTEVKDELESVCLHLQELSTRIHNKQSVLGVTDRAWLNNLMNNPFFAARMNALALKQHLHDWLCAQKFEMEQLEHSFHKQINDHKVDTHTASSVKQCEPAITKVARSLNVLCNTMEDLFKRGNTPPGATCLKKLDIKGIFALNVDDTIWEDLGLDKWSLTPLPPWLSDEGVQAGIRALLEYDRCIKEKVRLQHKCRSMHFWLSEEWHIVNLALGTDDASLSYHLRLRRSSLLRLCFQWQLSVNLFDFGDPASLPDWGPSTEDIDFLIVQKTAVVKEVLIVDIERRDTERIIELERQERDEESEYSDSENGEADIILFDILDAVDASWPGEEDEEYMYDL
ncbi:hypothetical protein DXG01_014961 [Tephrocybe rancida]|nr:hypothetical protein DXG01_014961 [Tephrocybe rancida]